MKRLITGIGICAIALTLSAPQVFASTMMPAVDKSVIVINGMVNGKTVEQYIQGELANGKELSVIVSTLIYAGAKVDAVVRGAIAAGVSPALAVQEITRVAPASVVEIATVATQASPKDVAAIASAAAMEVPDAAVEIAGALAAEEPDQAAAIIFAVTGAAPEQMAAIKAAVDKAVLLAKSDTIQQNKVGSPGSPS